MGFKIKFKRPIGAVVGGRMASGWKDIVLEEAGKVGLTRVPGLNWLFLKAATDHLSAPNRVKPQIKAHTPGTSINNGISTEEEDNEEHHSLLSPQSARTAVEPWTQCLWAADFAGAKQLSLILEKTSTKPAQSNHFLNLCLLFHFILMNVACL